MKLRILLAIFSFLTTIVAFVVEMPVDRSPVKILADQEALKIDWTPKHTTVKSMTTLVQPFPAKNKKIDKTVRFGYEFNTYEMKCGIREFSKDDQGNYHLVLEDLNDSTTTLVGVILNPEAPELVGSQYMGSFKNTREEFELFALPGNKVMESIYTITGVCFFDEFPEPGAAPNLVEIYPIMDIITDFK